MLWLDEMGLVKTKISWDEFSSSSDPKQSYLIRFRKL